MRDSRPEDRAFAIEVRAIGLVLGKKHGKCSTAVCVGAGLIRPVVEQCLAEGLAAL